MFLIWWLGMWCTYGAIWWWREESGMRVHVAIVGLLMLFWPVGLPIVLVIRSVEILEAGERGPQGEEGGAE